MIDLTGGEPEGAQDLEEVYDDEGNDDEFDDDAYEFGCWEAAQALSLMFAAELEKLTIDDAHYDYCAKSAASWHRLAERSRLRAAAREPDPSRD